MMREINVRRSSVQLWTATLLGLAVGAGAGPALAQQSDVELQPLVTGNPFFDKATAGYTFRTAYFDRRTNGDDKGVGRYDANAMGLGGWIYGRTGELWDTISFGATYNFTLPLYAPNDTTNANYILRFPGQDTVSVLGEAFIKARFGDHSIVLGRQEINNSWYMQDVVRFYNTIDQSMVGRYDIRGMQPIQFSGVTAKGKLMEDTLRYYGGWVWGVRSNAENPSSPSSNTVDQENRFTSLGEYNGKAETNGGGYAGIQYKPTKDSMVEGSYYAFQDLLDMVYLSADYVHRLQEKNYLRFGAQFFFQSGNGSNLLSNGKDFNTNAWALYGEFKLLPHLIPYISYGETDKEQQIRSPFAIGPHYATHRIMAMPVAGEKTMFFGTIVDFGPFGAKGFTFDLAYAHRISRRQDFDGGPLPDWKELSTDFVYIYPGEGFFKNMRTRLRWATVTEEGGHAVLAGDRTWQDIRFDISLNIPFK